MTRRLHVLTLRITLRAPYLVHGNDPGRYGLGAVLLRDHRQRPILPGTLVAGRIAETWHNLGDRIGAPSADLWFGRGGDSPGCRARLMVDDLVLLDIDGRAYTPDTEAPFLSRIRCDNRTGAVKPGALLTVEQIARPGAGLLFQGDWRTWASDGEIASLLPRLRAALLLQTQLGALRGIGFGRLLEATVTASSPAIEPPAPDPQWIRQRWVLRSAMPLVVGSRHRRGNVFESSGIIGGGSILGALATMLAARHGAAPNDMTTPLARHFSALRCTHALPTPRGGRRPLPLPLSLITIGSEFRDAWRWPAPPPALPREPEFDVDWKPHISDEAARLRGWGRLRRHLRVRADIDGEGVAKDAALFAHECVVAPLDGDQPATEWHFDLDLSAVAAPERQAVSAEIAELLGHGLLPLGKTDAVMSAHVAGPTPAAAVPGQLRAGEPVPLLLVSDALLFPTDAIADRTAIDLHAIYAAAFADLAHRAGGRNALRLSHFFARQKLAGGEYWFHRYLTPRHDRPAPRYQPWVLTEAGSVFVFTVDDPVAAYRVLRAWAEAGLDLPEAVHRAYGDAWTDHPFRPRTGYGEVAVGTGPGFAEL